MKSRTKVESNAIDIIRLIVDKSDKLLPDPTFGDKGISTDGCILLYKNSETDKAENFLREIKIQIKGRTDKTKSKTHLCQTKIKETVEVKDLENYSRFGGAVFFFVYFDKEFNDHSVYYSVLMPVKIKSYLSIAQRAHSKGVPITFDRLIEDGDTIFNICAQFYQEQKRQGFGDGQVLEHIVSWKDLKGETTLSATAVGVSNEMDFLKRIARGDIYFYTKIGDFKVPMEWEEGGVFVKRTRIIDDVEVADRVYFNEFDVEINTESDKWILYIGKCICFDFEHNKYSFNEAEATIKELAVASEFFLALKRESKFKIGSAVVEVNGINIGADKERRMQYYAKLRSILYQIGLDMNDRTYWKMDVNVRKQLSILYEISEGSKNDCFIEKYTHYDWPIEGKIYPLVVVLGENKNGNEIYSFLFTRLYQTYCEGEGGMHFVVPTFAFPSYKTMRMLYHYDIIPIREQVNRMTVNSNTVEYINTGALKLINLYDATGDNELLDLADRSFVAIKRIYTVPEYIFINRMQIKRRKCRISRKDRENLQILLSNSDATIRFASSVLLEDRDRAIIEAGSIEKNVWDEIIDTPIYFLYEKLFE